MSTIPPSPPGQNKPSTLASCILVGLILGALGAVGGGGFWAYKKFTASPAAVLATSTPPSPPASLPTNPELPKPDDRPKPVPSPEPAPAPPEPAPALGTPPPIPTPEPLPPAPAPPAASPKMVETGPAPQAQEEPAKTPEVPSEADPVVNQEPVQSFEETAPEVTALKADADRRINEAPAEDYSDSDKQKVREALKLAKRLTRIATLQFGAGSTKLGNRERTRFKNALLTPEAEAILSDPQAVFFTIGYADATGTTQLNRQISKERATGVEALLKTFKVPNKCYSVGIGTTTLLSADLQSKNRAVEVWVVLP